MKKLGLLFSVFAIIGLSASVVHALKCGPFPAQGTCGVNSYKALLQATNNIKYWQNPKCLELVIAEVEKTGTKTSDDDKKSITKGFNTADEAWKKNPDQKAFWQYADRKNYINYKIGYITSGSSCSIREDGSTVCRAAPGCSVIVEGTERVLDTAEEIVNFISAYLPSHHSLENVFKEIGRQKICLMKLNTLRNKQWENSQEYLSILQGLTSEGVINYINARLDSDDRKYDKCVFADELGKMKNFLNGKVPSGDGGKMDPRDRPVGPGVGSQGTGGHGGGGGAKPKPQSTGHKISHFEIDAK